jgi:hypothetical protein
VQKIFQPDYIFKASTGTWGLHGVVRVPNRTNDWIFFVSYGQSQSGHEFDEGITRDGVLTWQSQPRQTLTEDRVLNWINQDHEIDNIHLFLRPSRHGEYYYLGKLNYLLHDSEREKPVWFQFQIQDFDPPEDLLDLVRGDGEAGFKDKETNTVKIPMEFAPPDRGKRNVPTRAFKAKKIPDLSGKEARDKELGLAGEYFVLQLEQNRLRSLGLNELADKVEHTSQIRGDGAGFDIRSYNEDGSDLFIEVKTTQGGIRSGFYITPNELAFSEQKMGSFVIWRVFNFDPEMGHGHYFKLTGDLRKKLHLAPVNYRATL